MSILIPLILNVPLLVLGIFGGNEIQICLIKNGPIVNDVLEIMYTSLIPSLTILYCGTVSLLVILRIKEEFHARKASGLTNSSGEKLDSIYSLWYLARRTCLYPSSCFLSCIGSSVSTVYYFFFRKRPLGLILWEHVGLGLMGILSLLAFVADPEIFAAIPEIFKGARSNNPLNPDFYQMRINSDSAMSYENLAGPVM
ncbi:hypothetical protein DSO57_1024118 [Entomophthora muscae]|uniref:Uncharacterized protein n=1 Tax=Entomophthora muscae TaxID=34485 RepID=A0ACC2U0J8_9FUNG|nr:hypothetical protein DSO57_1024118 [Entomophthora muscae]